MVTKPAKTVTNISKSPTHLISYNRHQHRCGRLTQRNFTLYSTKVYIIWTTWKVSQAISTNTKTNAEKLIFFVQFSENRFEFAMIFIGFRNSAISAFQIQVSFTVFKNPKIPGSQPKHWSNCQPNSDSSLLIWSFWLTDYEPVPAILK